ncbi:hypothetical protein MANES_03G026901v8 [Manihot esculenta]|uniref:Uncharacterized protein n=1 Tax=Manihot esculenta TaxID=3983 RepID=A0ACC8DUI5_MANES|nr:hypothetical protein MANES_03G026901v8 [Manihot esculenta]
MIKDFAMEPEFHLLQVSVFWACIALIKYIVLISLKPFKRKKILENTFEKEVLVTGETDQKGMVTKEVKAGKRGKDSERVIYGSVGFDLKAGYGFGDVEGRERKWSQLKQL